MNISGASCGEIDFWGNHSMDFFLSQSFKQIAAIGMGSFYTKHGLYSKCDNEIEPFIVYSNIMIDFMHNFIYQDYWKSFTCEIIFLSCTVCIPYVFMLFCLAVLVFKIKHCFYCLIVTFLHCESHHKMETLLLWWNIYDWVQPMISSTFSQDGEVSFPVIDKVFTLFVLMLLLHIQVLFDSCYSLHLFCWFIVARAVIKHSKLIIVMYVHPLLSLP